MKYILSFAFTFIAGISLNAQCDKNIITEKDKFTEAITVSTVSSVENPDGQEVGTNILVDKKQVLIPIKAYKKIDKSGSVHYTMIASVKGDRGYYSQKGLFLILESGTKIYYPEASVSRNYLSVGYIFTAAATISEDEFDKLTKVSITDVRVGNNDCELSPWLGGAFQKAIACLK